jgi:hypothetical protein
VETWVTRWKNQNPGELPTFYIVQFIKVFSKSSLRKYNIIVLKPTVKEGPPTVARGVIQHSVRPNFAVQVVSQDCFIRGPNTLVDNDDIPIGIIVEPFVFLP